MAATNPIEQMNRELAEKLIQEATRDPQGPYAGNFIGIANGRVVAVSKDWIEVDRTVRAVEPNLRNGYVIEIGSDGREVHHIGSFPRPIKAPASNGRELSAAEKRNRELGEQIIAEARRNPQAFPGKYIGIANGRVVVVTDDLDELGRELGRADTDPANLFWVEPGRNEHEVYEIWESY